MTNQPTEKGQLPLTEEDQSIVKVYKMKGFGIPVIGGTIFLGFGYFLLTGGMDWKLVAGMVFVAFVSVAAFIKSLTLKVESKECYESTIQKLKEKEGKIKQFTFDDGEWPMVSMTNYKSGEFEVGDRCLVHRAPGERIIIRLEKLD